MYRLPRFIALVVVLGVCTPAGFLAKPVNKCQAVVGTWRISSLGLPWTYDVRADGTAIVDDWNRMTWTCAGNVVTFRNGMGASVRLTLSADGNHVSGTMTNGAAASGVRTSAPPAVAVAAGTRAKRGAAGGPPAKGSARARYCASKWVIWRDNWLRIYEEEFNIDDEPMPPEAIENNRRQFTARCMAGDEPALDGNL